MRGRKVTHVAHVNSGDTSSPIVPHALDHLVQNLARVCLGAQRHLQPVHPSLGVLASGTLDGHVWAPSAAELLELAHHRLLVRHTKAKLLEVDKLELVLVLRWPSARNEAQSRLRVDKDDLASTLVQRIRSSHLPDGTDAEYGDLVVGVDGGVFDCVVSRGEDVGEVQGWWESVSGPRPIQRCCNGKTVGLPFSSGTSSGIASRLTSPNGTRTYSAWPPAKPPVKCEYPKMPAVLPPYMALVMVLELVISHWDESFCLQKKQSPQAIWNETTYRFPTSMPLTEGPTCSTMPQNSCPRISPLFICMMAPAKGQSLSRAVIRNVRQSNQGVPWRRCRSLPQTVVPVTLRMTSRSSMIFGFGTSTTSTFCFPCHARAFMVSFASPSPCPV